MRVKIAKFSRCYAAFQIPWLYPKLFANVSLFSDSGRYTIIFSQSLINVDFFTSGIGLDILINVIEGYIIFVIWVDWILIFMSTKTKGFDSGALLKIIIIFIIMFCFFWKCLYNPCHVTPRNLRYVKAVKSSLKFIVYIWYYI